MKTLMGIIFCIGMLSSGCASAKVQADPPGPVLSAPNAPLGQAPALGSKVLASTPAAPQVCIPPAKDGDYAIGVNDILTIDVMQPEHIESNVTVSPDGNISFPYIGTIPVKGRSLSEVEQDIQIRLASGYLKYPLVVVYLKESRSRSFFVYGEVNKPGPYELEDNTTVLRAISMAGGFTRFGSASHVKVLRPKRGNVGYDTMRIDIKAVMMGDSEADLLLKPGDIVVVSEGMF